MSMVGNRRCLKNVSAYWSGGRRAVKIKQRPTAKWVFTILALIKKKINKAAIGSQDFSTENLISEENKP